MKKILLSSLFVFSLLCASVNDDVTYVLDILPIESNVIAAALSQAVPCMLSNEFINEIRSFKRAASTDKRNYYAQLCLQHMGLASDDAQDFGRILIGRYNALRGNKGDPLYMALVAYFHDMFAREDIFIE